MAAAVDVGVGHDHHFVVAQVVEHAVGRFGRVWVDAQRHGDVMHFAVGEQTAGVDFPGVGAPCRAAAGSLVLPCRGLTAEPPAESPSTRKSSLRSRSSLWAVGELAGQDGDRRLFFLLDFFCPAGARLRGLDRQFGDLLGEGRVSLSQFERKSRSMRATRATASRG